VRCSPWAQPGDPEATLRALLADGVPLPALEVRGASLEDAVLASHESGRWAPVQRRNA